MSVLDNIKQKSAKGDWRTQYAKPFLEGVPTAAAIGGGMLGASAGAAAGGVGAFPGGVAGAAAGGAGGEAFKQIGERALGLGGPETSGAAADKISGAFNTQAAYEMASPIIGAASSKAGKALMTAATKFSPEIAQIALREGITAGRRGLAKVESILGDLGAKTRALAAQHTASGVRFDPNKDIIQGALADVLPSVMSGKDPTGERKRLIEMAKTWLEGRVSPLPLNTATAQADGVYMRATRGQGGKITATKVGAGGGMTPIELLRSKQSSDKIAEPLWNKAGKGIVQRDVDPLEQQFHQALANRMRDALHSIDRGVPGGLAELDARASDLMKLKAALFPVAKKEMSFLARWAGRSLPTMGGTLAGALMPGDPGQRVGHAALGGAIGAGVSPGTLSQLALAMRGPEGPILRELMKQSPRLIGMMAAPADKTQ